MDKSEKQAHLDAILSTISSIQQRTKELDYRDFQQEEAVREEIYAELQEIGQNAADFLVGADTDLDLRNDLELLSKLKGATFNQHTEVNHQSAWNIIKDDLQVIGERLEQSESYVH